MSQDRSVSRGRDYQSTGRGGSGNIVRDVSISRGGASDGPDDFSQTRGREPVSFRDPSEIVSTGRGGAGNIRSPSRDAEAARAAQLENDRLVHSIDAARDTGVYSSGRGGLGNIVTPTRSQSREPVASTGRGGAGNLGRAPQADIRGADDVERAALAHREGLHSTGRGGAANVTADAAPAPEHAHVAAGADEVRSSGRGGAGNISRSGSREPGHHKEHGISALLHRVARSTSRTPKDKQHEGEPGADDLPVGGVPMNTSHYNM